MLVIAHRGASGYAPENTLASFRKALDLGCDGVEFDVQLTKDGELVVCHDYAVDRTTNGSGQIKEMTLSEIRALDAGVWFDAEFKGEKIPTLEEVLEVIPQGMPMNIEIKNIASNRRNIEEKVMELLIRRDRVDDVLLSSFDHLSLKTIREIHSDVKIGVLTYAYLLEPAEYMKKHGFGAIGIHPAEEYVNEKFVEEMHRQGYRVCSYTVNDRAAAERLEAMNVDAIFSNYPDLLSR